MELKARVKGEPEPTVAWYRDDKPMVATLKVAIGKTDDEHSIAIQQVSSSATGTYRCVATNEHGSAQHSALVTVTGRYIASLSPHLVFLPYLWDLACAR